ncbi:MAG TPA: class I SAM-dependent methyltransferase [Ramlibacter sp.]|nr:class I SAM-dependent methyltransferase [Ramlibacter sp.]
MQDVLPNDSAGVRRRLVLAGLAVAPLPVWAQDPAKPKLDVHYVPTPQEVVDKMLEMAQVDSSDVLYDLGCGDGRIVITAASKFGARGVGIDLDPERIAEARANARSAGVEKRVQFRQANLFKSDFSRATVVTLYLLPALNERLRPQLWRQLKPGTRVISHAFNMGAEWPPEQTERVDNKTIFAWTIKSEHKKRKA